MERYMIVQTDNFGGDYPDESFVLNLPYLSSKEKADKIADAINKTVGENHGRYWKVVKIPYTLAPSFEL